MSGQSLRVLGEMSASGSVEVREDGEWLVEPASLPGDLQCEGKSALVHLWSDERNLKPRVVRVKERSERRVLLGVSRGNYSAHGFDASSLKVFPTLRLNRSAPPRTWNILFPDCMFAGLCGKRSAVGLFWRFSARKRRGDSREYWRMEFCGWTGHVNTRAGARYRACDGLFQPGRASRFASECLLCPRVADGAGHFIRARRCSKKLLRSDDAGAYPSDPIPARSMRIWMRTICIHKCRLWQPGDRGVIDLLGVTTRGRLVVMELKASATDTGRGLLTASTAASVRR